MASFTSQFLTVSLFVIVSFQMALSAPVSTAVSQNNNKKLITFPSKFQFNHPTTEEAAIEMEMLKRDFEEPIFIDPPESDQFSVFYNLPRTDRKNNYLSNYFENQMSINGEENPFENLSIDLRSIPMDTVDDDTVEPAAPKLQSPPSQKELLGPIVVGPQTKSTQTNSAKKY